MMAWRRAFADEGAADTGFGVAAEEDAVGEDAGAFAGGFEGADNVEEVGVVAWFGGGSAEGWKRLWGSWRGSTPVVQRLSLKGGLATT